jgi:hypothetical protein
MLPLHACEGHCFCVSTAPASRRAQLHLFAAQVQVLDNLVHCLHLLLCVQVDQDGPLEGGGGEPEQAVQGAHYAVVNGDPEEGGVPNRIPQCFSW